ncbi:MAG: MFS transporter [Haloferacaceae archaeon]
MTRRDVRVSRWWFVAVAALAMGTAGIYQFGWSSIRLALGARTGAPETALGTVFTLFVVFQTVAQFPAGWVRDRYGPRIPLLAGAGCLALGFAGVGLARSLPAAYAAYAVGGVGVGVAYTIAVNTAVKWFTDRRGLATGIVTMAYSGVSFLVIPAIRLGVDSAFETTLFALAGATGAAALLAAVVLRDPDGATATDGGESAGVDDDHTTGDESTGIDASDERSHTWREAIRTWQFWLLYGVFVVVNGVGLMVIGKVVSYASALSLPAFAGTASASMVALADAGGVFVVGGLSDRFGRRRTAAASLVLCGIALAGAVAFGARGVPLGFVALIAAAAFFRSPPFSIFPSIVGEFYGRAHSSENYAALYTAKLFGGVFGGTVASALVVSIGWSQSFALGAGLIALAGVAVTFLRPVSTD